MRILKNIGVFVEDINALKERAKTIFIYTVYYKRKKDKFKFSNIYEHIRNNININYI